MAAKRMGVVECITSRSTNEVSGRACFDVRSSMHLPPPPFEDGLRRVVCGMPCFLKRRSRPGCVVLSAPFVVWAVVLNALRTHGTEMPKPVLLEVLGPNTWCKLGGGKARPGRDAACLYLHIKFSRLKSK